MDKLEAKPEDAIAIGRKILVGFLGEEKASHIRVEARYLDPIDNNKFSKSRQAGGYCYYYVMNGKVLSATDLIDIKKK